MADAINERLLLPHPPDANVDRQELAILHCDDKHPFREHVVCYRAAGSAGERPRFVVVAMSARESDFFDYQGPAPAERDLAPGAVYLVRNSPRAVGEDTEHVIVALADRTIEFTGLALNVSPPIEAPSAAAALWRHMGQWLGDDVQSSR